MERKPKVHMMKGDVVQFTLIPVAKFTKGNFFEGTVIANVPKEFCVRVVPSAAAKKKLEKMLDKFGLITLPYRCCRIKSMAAHKALIQATRAAIERERKEREEAKEAAKKALLLKSMQDLRGAFKGPESKDKKKKKKKKPADWTWRP